VVKSADMGYAARRKAARRLKGCASDGCDAEQDAETNSIGGIPTSVLIFVQLWSILLWACTMNAMSTNMIYNLYLQALNTEEPNKLLKVLSLYLVNWVPEMPSTRQSISRWFLVQFQGVHGISGIPSGVHDSCVPPWLNSPN
jgi:hypothetical protein